VNLLGKAIALDLSVGLGLALVGLVAPELRKRAEEKAREALAVASPELADELARIEEQ
jgi:hypothetical protein